MTPTKRRETGEKSLKVFIMMMVTNRMPEPVKTIIALTSLPSWPSEGTTGEVSWGAAGWPTKSPSHGQFLSQAETRRVNCDWQALLFPRSAPASLKSYLISVSFYTACCGGFRKEWLPAPRLNIVVSDGELQLSRVPLITLTVVAVAMIVILLFLWPNFRFSVLEPLLFLLT